LLRQPDFNSFCWHFEQAMAAPPSASLGELRRIAATAFELLLSSAPVPDEGLFAWFANQHDRGNVEPTPRLAGLILRLERHLNRRRQDTAPPRLDGYGDVIEMKRVVQTSWFGIAGFQASDAFEIKRSVYNSPQERAFFLALWQRFPGLRPLPNYPFDQIVDMDRLRSLVSPEAWRYGLRCRIDAILVTSMEGDPVAAFELDSRLHDRSDNAERDRLKNELFDAAALPLLRIRVDDPNTTGIDEFFGLLSDQALDKVRLGSRLRTRDLYTSLVPLYR
jgi:hypothetical protein